MNGYVHPGRAARSRAPNATVVPPTTSGLLRAAFPGRGLAKSGGREFGLHPDTVRHYAAGRVVPSADRLLAMAAQSPALRRELMRVLQEQEQDSVPP